MKWIKAHWEKLLWLLLVLVFVGICVFDKNWRSKVWSFMLTHPNIFWICAATLVAMIINRIRDKTWPNERNWIEIISLTLAAVGGVAIALDAAKMQQNDSSTATFAGGFLISLAAFRGLAVLLFRKPEVPLPPPPNPDPPAPGKEPPKS